MVRNIRPDELDEVLRVEAEAWDESVRAPRERFESRMRIFPQGFFGAYRDGRLIGVSTSQIVRDPIDDHRWEEITGNGYITTHNPDGNVLYLVSLGVSRSSQSRGAGQLLVEAQKNLVRELSLDMLVSGSRISQYKDYVEKNGDINVEDYVKLRKDGTDEPYDMSLRFFHRCGLKPFKIVTRYLAKGDAESMDYNIRVVWHNPGK